MLNYWSKQVGIDNYEQDKEQVNSKEDNKKLNNNIGVIDTKTEEKKKEEESKNKTEDNKIVVDENVIKNNDNSITSNEESLISENKEESINDGSVEEEDYASAFKVSKSDIMSSLSLLDKGKILIIATKLSSVDYKKTQEFLQIGDEKGIINAMKLLKEKLSEEDYSKVREVAEKFLNMEIVENKLFK